MAFILSAQRDSEHYSSDLFEAYLAYLDSIQKFFPPKAFEIARNASWYGMDSDGPHDATLKEMQLNDHWSEEGETSCSLVMVIEKTNGEELKLEYAGVSSYNLEMPKDTGNNHGMWRYDEFSLDSPYQVKHEIEWSDGAVWKICATELCIHPPIKT